MNQNTANDRLEDVLTLAANADDEMLDTTLGGLLKRDDVEIDLDADDDVRELTLATLIVKLLRSGGMLNFQGPPSQSANASEVARIIDEYDIGSGVVANDDRGETPPVQSDGLPGVAGIDAFAPPVGEQTGNSEISDNAVSPGLLGGGDSADGADDDGDSDGDDLDANAGTGIETRDDIAKEIVANSAKYSSTEQVFEDFPTMKSLRTKRDVLTSGGSPMPPTANVDYKVDLGDSDEPDVDSGVLTE